MPLCFAILAFLSLNSVKADVNTDTDRLIDWAEATFYDFFSAGGQQSQSLVIEDPNSPFVGRWYYRFYPHTANFIALRNEQDIYLYGGVFGNQLSFIDSLGNLLKTIPPANQCVNVPQPKQGVVAEYQINNIAEGIDNGTLVDTFTSVSPTGSVIDSQIIGQDKTITVKEIQVFEIKENQLFLSQTDTTSNQALIDITSTLKYDPAILVQPALVYCEGQRWQTNKATLTSSLNPGSGTSRPSPVQIKTGKVNAVNVNITIPAGTFSTVKQTIVDDNGGKIESWIAIENGLVVLKRESNKEGFLIFTQILKNIR